MRRAFIVAVMVAPRVMAGRSGVTREHGHAVPGVTRRQYEGGAAVIR